MTKFFSALVLATVTLAGAHAFADIFVPYGEQWTDLPHCGGRTRLICPDADNARVRGLCEIQFQNSYSCPLINLYTLPNYYPNTVYSYGQTTIWSGPRTHVDLAMKGSFQVRELDFPGRTDFYVYLHTPSSGDGVPFEQIHYHYSY